MKNETIIISRINTDLPLPEYKTAGSFGFDLASRENITIPPNSLARIPSNCIIQAPAHLALQIIPRSSLFAKKKLLFPHSIGLIDSDYCGENDEILIQVYNFSDTTTEVKIGERLGQGVFLHTQKAEWKEVLREDLSTSRGGFGST